MVKRDVTYEMLAHLLKGHGWQATEKALRNKLSRGSFSADFFLAALRALGARSLAID
jgi:hypothetical protein